MNRTHKERRAAAERLDRKHDLMIRGTAQMELHARLGEAPVDLYPRGAIPLYVYWARWATKGQLSDTMKELYHDAGFPTEPWREK